MGVANWCCSWHTAACLCRQHQRATTGIRVGASDAWRTAHAATPLPQGECTATNSDDPHLPDGAAITATRDGTDHHVHVPPYTARAPIVTNHGAVDGNTPIEERLPFAKKSDAKSRSLPPKQSTSTPTVDMCIVDASVIGHIIGQLAAEAIVACRLDNMEPSVNAFDAHVRRLAGPFAERLRARCGGDGVQLIGVLDGALDVDVCRW